MDNRYWNYGCPPLMQDGRFLTNYIRGNVVDQFIRTTNKLDSAHSYRVFLQQNGNQIVNKEKAYLIENNTCSVNGQCMPIGEYKKMKTCK